MPRGQFSASAAAASPDAMEEHGNSKVHFPALARYIVQSPTTLSPTSLGRR